MSSLLKVLVAACVVASAASCGPSVPAQSGQPSATPSAPAAPPSPPATAPARPRLSLVGDLARIPFEQKLAPLFFQSPDRLLKELGDAKVCAVENKISGAKNYAVAYELKFETAIVVLDQSQFEKDDVRPVMDVAFFEHDALPGYMTGSGLTWLSDLLDETRAARTAATSAHAAARLRAERDELARAEIEGLFRQTGAVDVAIYEAKTMFERSLTHDHAEEAVRQLQSAAADGARSDQQRVAEKDRLLRALADPDKAVAEARQRAATIAESERGACLRVRETAKVLVEKMRAQELASAIAREKARTDAVVRAAEERRREDEEFDKAEAARRRGELVAVPLKTRLAEWLHGAASRVGRDYEATLDTVYRCARCKKTFKQGDPDFELSENVDAAGNRYHVVFKPGGGASAHTLVVLKRDADGKELTDGDVEAQIAKRSAIAAERSHMRVAWYCPACAAEYATEVHNAKDGTPCAAAGVERRLYVLETDERVAPGWENDVPKR